MSTVTWFRFKDRFLRLTRISNVPVFTIPHENNTDVSVSHEQVDTQYSPLLCAFPPLLLSDGVELTGAESFTVSGSKDKLLNTHAQVTYVFARLPDSFSSPTCSVSPSLPLFLVCLVFTLLLFFSFRLREQNEFLHTGICYLALCDWISFCQVHKITFQQQDRVDPCQFARCLYIKWGRRLL